MNGAHFVFIIKLNLKKLFLCFFKIKTDKTLLTISRPNYIAEYLPSVLAGLWVRGLIELASTVGNRRGQIDKSCSTVSAVSVISPNATRNNTNTSIKDKKYLSYSHTCVTLLHLTGIRTNNGNLS